MAKLQGAKFLYDDFDFNDGKREPDDRNLKKP